jgi:hypothetical protein
MPTAIPETALEQLYQIMRDLAAPMRVRLNSAVSASRVEPLVTHGDKPPPAVSFLQHIIQFRKDGKAYKADYRRTAGAALAYYERRAKKAELLYKIPNLDQRNNNTRRLLNSLLRQHLWAAARWPQDKHLLLGPADDIPDINPELAISALLLDAPNQSSPKAKQKAVDQPLATQVETPLHRQQILRNVAAAMARALDMERK